MLQTFLSLTLSILLAFSCCHHAKRRGRHPGIWFILGALFGILALIVLFILPLPKARRNQKPDQPPLPKAPPLAAISPLHREKLWYYLDEEKNQFGPMSLHALGRAWDEKKIQERTFVWNEAMENWQHLKEVITQQQTNS